MKTRLYFKLLIFCLLSMITWAQPASAARFTGAYLLHVCEIDEDGLEKVRGGHTACQAYIGGVLDYHSVLQSLKLSPKVDICIPQKVSMNDIHAIVLAYLRKHKEHDGFIAAPAVTMALYQKYPCKKGR